MKPLEMIVLINPADLAPWNGAEVPVRFAISDTSIQMEFGSPPGKPSHIEYLRMEFAKIESQISGQSLEIMRFILAAPLGETPRKSLIKHIWGGYIPTSGRVRNAIWELNALLERLNFGYRIKSHRKGIIRIEIR